MYIRKDLKQMKDMGGNCNALTGKEVKDLAGVRKL